MINVISAALVFTVVSDPQNEEGDCADVAYASVDFLQVSNEPGKQKLLDEVEHDIMNYQTLVSVL